MEQYHPISLYSSQQIIKLIVRYLHLTNVYKFINKNMRQDLQERQRQIRKLHKSIQKYKISPRTQANISRARADLEQSIQEKFINSQANQNYIFPRNQPISDQQGQLGKNDRVNLHDLNNDIGSLDLSVAEQPQKNQLYVSEKTMLIERNDIGENQDQNTSHKLKIKLFKKKKLPKENDLRIKTEYVQKQYSSIIKLSNINKKQGNKMNYTFKEPTALGDKKSKIKHNKSLSRFHQTSLSPFHSCLQDKTPYKQQSSTYSRTTNKLNDKYYIGQTSKTIHSHKKAFSKQNLKPNKSKLNFSIKNTINKNLFEVKKDQYRSKGLDDNQEIQLKKDNVKIIRLGTSSRQKRKARHII